MPARVPTSGMDVSQLPRCGTASFRRSSALAPCTSDRIAVAARARRMRPIDIIFSNVLVLLRVELEQVVRLFLRQRRADELERDRVFHCVVDAGEAADAQRILGEE